MSKKYYLSTAIAYTSSKPHIGNVYEAILADAMARFKRKEGYDVYFQTGTDEHGQKIEQKALDAGITPQEHVDMVSSVLKSIYDNMNVSYDKFIRTTDKDHMKVVSDIYQKLFDNGDIYKGHYEGYYCVSCETFFTEKDLVDGHCPDCGAEVKLTREEAYFLRLSKYQDRLIKHIQENPHFIEPESRKNEMLNNFLKEELPDLCVSRSSFKWGIPLPFNQKHVSYVWIDALANYISGLGYSVYGESSEKFNKYWPADVHLIGKDILRFHTIYWPIILMALDLELPKQIFGHPWVLMNNNKMSKSKGNIIYADDLVDIFGVDAVRYYVLHEIPFAQDGNLAYELVCERTNTDLANTLGNLVNRTIAMGHKYFGGKVSKVECDIEFNESLISLASNLYTEVSSHMDSFRVTYATEDIMKVLRRANKYIDETAPWVLAKDEEKAQELECVLYNLLETIRICAILLEPFMPSTAQSIYSQINTTSTSFEDARTFGVEASYNLGEASVLFARLKVEDVLASVEAKTPAAPAPKKAVKEEPAKPEITFPDFEKLDLVVGKVLSCEKHENAKKLLVSQVNVGRETMQIVSGIATYYTPEEMVGKSVLVLKNLAPIKLRGVLSSGMLLCGEDKETGALKLVEMKGLNPGDEVS